MKAVLWNRTTTTALFTMLSDSRLGRMCDRPAGADTQSLVLHDSSLQRTYGRPYIRRSTELWTTILVDNRGSEQCGKRVLAAEDIFYFVAVYKDDFWIQMGKMI